MSGGRLPLSGGGTVSGGRGCVSGGSVPGIRGLGSGLCISGG